MTNRQTDWQNSLNFPAADRRGRSTRRTLRAERACWYHFGPQTFLDPTSSFGNGASKNLGKFVPSLLFAYRCLIYKPKLPEFQTHIHKGSLRKHYKFHRNRARQSTLRCDKIWKIYRFLFGPIIPNYGPIYVKFVNRRDRGPLHCTKFYVNSSNESPLPAKSLKSVIWENLIPVPVPVINCVFH